MTTIGASLLIFIGMIGVGLLVMQPVLASYTQNYMLRIRSIHGAQYKTQTRIRSNSLTNFCLMVGTFTLQVCPKLANSGIKKALIEANLRSRDHLAILIGAKVLCAGMLSLFFVVQGSFILAAVAAFFAWTMPNYCIIGRAKQRKQKLFRELSTVIDLIAVCTKAGLGLLTSIDKVTGNLSETCPVMQEEFEQMLTDVRIFARPLRVALQDLSDRCGVEELDNFVAALITADQKGSDIGTTLQRQAVALRDRIKRKAEEQMSTAPVKMIPVIIFFMLPLILIPTAGPPVMQLVTIMGHMGAEH